jgi:hypothetical protein
VKVQSDENHRGRGDSPVVQQSTQRQVPRRQGGQTLNE